MNEKLIKLLDPVDIVTIEAAHEAQRIQYGVYTPPGLKQLTSLRHILVSTGIMSEVKPEQLLSLSKIQCRVLLKKLNSIYVTQMRNQIWKKVKGEKLKSVN